MATINLGAIKFNWKGAYAGGTAYAVDDVVSSGGSSYVCILASTGNATSNGTYWEQMSSAGTNGTDGTDLSTTLTTQGDVLYRDGSGLQRLAKGTASQVLAINSGATAPEWVDASGGKNTLLATTTISGSPTNVDFINGTNGVVINSTYEYYVIDFVNIASQTDVHMLYFQFLRNGSPHASGYRTTGSEWYRSASGGTETYRGKENKDNYDFGMVGASNAVGEQNFNGTMKFFPNGYGAEYPNFISRCSWWQDNDQTAHNVFGGTVPVNSEMSTFNGFRFGWHSNYGGNIGTTSSFSNQGKINLYGVKV